MMDRKSFLQAAFLSWYQKRAQARYAFPVAYPSHTMPLPANLTGRPP
ncbi:hypothetical protein Q0590_09730 [Rhodocytophaga aerolata]|uniref:Uncharacterized protein n=1 Tax=Rhodocytophaga aerolata TaxID=455078 RepID=A0ABT8R549_9BACT|nr:hypothetical protein [Rhodocytophaga aerolata]MDO1446529.1 hypothetical protein [Rhodocytophaga aerolata]